MRKKTFITWLSVLALLLSACASAGGDVVLENPTTRESETAAGSVNGSQSDSDSSSSDGSNDGSTSGSSDDVDWPDVDDVNLDGGGFTVDWHNEVEIPEEDAVTEEELPVAMRENDEYEYDVYEDHVVITKYLGNEAYVTVPSEIDSLPVTEIGGNVPGTCGAYIYAAFNKSDEAVGNGIPENTTLVSVTLPEGLTCINDMAFYNCTALEYIEIPDTLTYIGYSAFYGTPWLENQTEEFVTVGDSLLIRYNGTDTEVTVPDGVKGIYGAFRDNSEITSVHLPESVTWIGTSAFHNCTSLESVNFPESLEGIGAYAFCRTPLTEVTLSAAVIGTGAFKSCKNLTTVNLEEGVREIEAWAFDGCVALEEITFPESLITIGAWAFYECTSLASVCGGANVTRVDYNAFYLTPWLDAQSDYYVVVGKNVLIKYNGADAAITLPDTITFIGGAFVNESTVGDNQNTLTSLIIPASVCGISDSFGAQALETIEFLGESVTFADNSYFSSRLTEFKIPEGTQAITESMFLGCSMTSIEIPDSVRIISVSAFQFCENLTEVTIPDSVIALGEYAFYGCSSLTDITIPASVTRIGKEAFEECPNLVIHGVTGSKAWEYATENGIPFVEVD